MVQGPSSAALEALRDASASIDEQIAILRQLKNDIAGHQQRKELVVKQAAVEPLVRVVATASGNGGAVRAGNEEGWSKQDEARLQATLILGSLADGGAAFMQPLLAAGVPDCLLSALDPLPSSKLLVATLRALRSLAEQSRANERSDNPVRVDVVDSRSLAVFESILREPERGSQWNLLFHLTIDIITAAAADEETRARIFGSVTWFLLLAVFTNSVTSYGPFSDHPDDGVVPRRDRAKVFSAVAAIIEGSHYRTEWFIHSSTLRSMLPHGMPWTSSFADVLPQIQAPPIKHVNFNSTSSSFPALASLQAASGERGAGIVASAPMAFDTQHVHAVGMFLISIAKSSSGPGLLPALRLLAVVNNAIDDHSYLVPQSLENAQRLRQRDRYIAICIVPLAVQLVQTASEPADTAEMSLSEQEFHRDLKPEACDLLASLIRSSKDLQVAAVEAGAIKRICPILKKSFDNVTSTKPMWSSRSSKDGADGSVPATCKLGSRGIPPEIDYAMRCRRAALEAIAALASKEDIHRQAIVQAGIVSCIIDSLKPFAADAYEKMGRNGAHVSPKDGNTAPVLIAACHAAQSMSRSVSLLRTSLIDAGIAKPVFELLKHPMLDVRVAATEVCCNLVLEFSPMREDLLSAGVLKTLTEHARQSEMGLRRSSLWALKHLVLAGSREIKIQALEEIGVGWLVAAVQGQQRLDSQEGALGGGVAINASGGLSAPNAAGERVSLLNPSSMDVDDPSGNSGDVEDDEDGEVLYDEASLTHYRSSHLRSTLTHPTASGQSANVDNQRYLDSIREMEQDSTLRARRDDIAVQEQGLDFIRNLINGDDCAYMFDHLLAQVGSTKIFAILTEKLAPLNPPSSTARGATTPSTRPIYSPTELILSTIHVITHIANGSPQQKQLLIAQKPLLSAWLPHFHHPDRRVRCISVWAVNSLTWIEDDHDRPAAQQRARELRNVGISAAVEGLRGDVDLDVRERVRVAVRQIEALG